MKRKTVKNDQNPELKFLGNVETEQYNFFMYRELFYVETFWIDKKGFYDDLKDEPYVYSGKLVRTGKFVKVGGGYNKCSTRNFELAPISTSDMNNGTSEHTMIIALYEMPKDEPSSETRQELISTL